MVRRPREPCSSKTSSVVSKTQRRFNRFLMLISTSVLNRVSNYDLIRCTLQLVVLRSGSGRTVRYTRDDLRTMLRRVVVPSSLTTSSVPNKAHRRFRRFQMFILYTPPSSYPLTFILYVCYYGCLRMSRGVPAPPNPLHSARKQGSAHSGGHKG